MSTALEDAIAEATNAPGFGWDAARAQRVFEGAVEGHRTRRRRHRILRLATMAVALSTFAIGALRANASVDEARAANESPGFTSPPPELALVPVATGPRIDDAGYGRD